MEPIQLPIKNESGYYEIRLESIGGLGANLAGKMLGELGIKYLGFNSASFSSYGSEKTGTPVKAYIRYCEADKEIRVHSPVTEPHLLGIFHDALMRDYTVLEGCTQDTVIVLNTEMAAKKTLEAVHAGMLYCLPAQKIAMETHSRINVVMLGAMAKAMGFVALDAVNQICQDTLGRKYPDALAANLEGIRRGYEEVTCISSASGAGKGEYTESREDAGVHEKIDGSGQAGSQEKADCDKDAGICKNLDGSGSAGSQEKVSSPPKDGAVWGYKTAPIGGINPHYGNSVISDLSASRQGYIPVFIQEKCINCGLCDSTCPDMVFQFGEGTYKGREMMVNKGLDYYHCKGCLRCVTVCPTNALVKALESEYPVKTWFLPNQELLRSPDYYEKTGADGYITSESFLTEKRIEGGEV